MSNLNRMERASADRRRALRRAEREDMLRVLGDDEQTAAPGSGVLAANPHDLRDEVSGDPRGGF